MFRGHELEGRMREWALAWHASHVAANPSDLDAREPTDLVLESIAACGLGDASDKVRAARLRMVPGGEQLVTRVDRVVVARKVTRAPPTDAEAIALARRSIEALRALGAWLDPLPPSIRVVRGTDPPRYRQQIMSDDLLPIVRRAASSEEARDAVWFLEEPLYQLHASSMLAAWAIWPFVEDALGPCPLDGAFELWERGASARFEVDGLVLSFARE